MNDVGEWLELLEAKGGEDTETYYRWPHTPVGNLQAEVWRRTGASDWNLDDPDCRTRNIIKTLSDMSQQIAPDTFDIIKVQDLTTGATGYSTHNFATRLVLSSNAQPDVYQMTCQQWSDASELDYPTVAQMEKAWGAAFTLQLRR